MTTTSSRARIARHLAGAGILYAGDPAWLVDRTVDSFLRGRARRFDGTLASCAYCHRIDGNHNGPGGHLFVTRRAMIGGVA